MKRLLVLALFTTALVAAEEEGKAEEKDYTGWKWANFALLVIGLGYLASKTLPAFYTSRDSEIRKGLDDARRMGAEAEARTRQIEARLAGLGTEIESLKSGARTEAEAEGDRIRRETAIEVERIQAHANEEIASAAKTAQAELKSYAASLALELARNKVAARITPADQEALLRSFARDMKAAR